MRELIAHETVAVSGGLAPLAAAVKLAPYVTRVAIAGIAAWSTAHSVDSIMEDRERQREHERKMEEERRRRERERGGSGTGLTHDIFGLPNFGLPHDPQFGLIRG
jgi:hypothetical protein